MPKWTLLFLSGILTLRCLTHLPSLNFIYPLAILIILTQCHLKLKPITPYLIGFTWSFLYAHYLLSWHLPPEWHRKIIPITGYIHSIPTTTQFQTNFQFKPETNPPCIIQLSTPNPKKPFIVGDKWTFYIKLKSIHGTRNPGGFDYEAWAFQNNICATGYVKNFDQSKLVSSNQPRYFFQRFRQSLKNKISEALPKTETSPWLLALTVGERENIAGDEWQILRNTGTNHLMAIAGLHIGLMSGFCFLLVQYLWRCIPYLNLFFPARAAAAVAALLMSIFYSALAGFLLPTQRACLMFAIFLMVFLFRRETLAWQVYCLSLIIVLLLNPFSVLTESFWLSFGSVAFITYGMNARLAPKGIWWKLGRIQWVVFLALIPFSVALFQQCSLVGFIANCLAIPVVGFIVVPLAFIGSLSLLIYKPIGCGLLWLADKILGLIWWVLKYLSQLPHAVWYQSIPSFWILILAIFAMILLLIPKGFPGRYFGLISLLPMFFYHHPTPKLGEACVTLLDVGQGLATVIQTQKHVLIFDTGPKFNDHFDMGESVVMPFLRSIGAKQVDTLVISHGDNDHIGGARSILKYFPKTTIFTSNPDKMKPFDSAYCLRGVKWIWDGVMFSFIYPEQDNLHENNDSSCVLQIKTKYKSVLLTGDIEKKAEKFLHLYEGKNLKTNVLIAPHHGSKTSGLKEFVDDVQPNIVLYPVGFENRYHFPHPTILDLYQRLGAKQYQTANLGAIQFTLDASDLTEFHFFRREHDHFWN